MHSSINIHPFKAWRVKIKRVIFLLHIVALDFLGLENLELSESVCLSLEFMPYSVIVPGFRLEQNPGY